VHAPARRVVDHERPGRGEPGRPVSRGAAAGGEDREVEPLDGFIVERPHDEPFAELAPGRAIGGEGDDLARAEAPLAQQLQHQRSDLPGGADDRDAVSLARHGAQGTAVVQRPRRVLASHP
jgi:hypothetical protein